jgi:16S rRNA pseudouridine516 synthase
LRILAPRLALLTLFEGRYHQVKRMVGSFRNPVLALHRVSIAGVALDESLAPGQYRALLPEEIALLRGAPSTGDPSP